MRLWHVDLLDVLPDRQFRGQLRELVAIMHDWRDKGATNHLLINKVMDYPKQDLVEYFYWYASIWNKRYGTKLNQKYYQEFKDFGDNVYSEYIFDDWHNDDYAKVCMFNLYEKYKFGKGKSKITEEEWSALKSRYLMITKDDWFEEN